MTRETVEAKALRYLSEGRVTIERVDRAGALATVAGDSGSWSCGWDARGTWCSCPARRRCAHLHALGLVVAVGGDAA